MAAIVAGRGDCAGFHLSCASEGSGKKIRCDSIVLIHDGVRPVVEYEVISENIASVKRYGSAITSTQCYETILVSHDGCSVDDLPLRKESYSAQAPQSFYLKDIMESTCGDR